MAGEPEKVMPMLEVAALFSRGEKTIRRWIESAGFPKPFYIEGRPYFRAIEIKLWQEAAMQNKTPPPREQKPRKRTPREN